MLGPRQLILGLHLGDIAIALETARVDATPSALAAYTSDGDRAEARCSLSLGELPDPTADPLLFDSGGVWHVRQHGVGIRIDLHVRGRVYQSLLLDEDLTHGEAVLDPSQIAGDDPEVGFALRSPMLQLWISFLLMRGRGLLVHGLGVLGDDGGVQVFAGTSGAGKSTLANVVVAAGAGRVLSDDRLIVRPAGDGFAVYGTPWHGEARHALNASGRLAGLHFLQQAPVNERSALNPSEAARRLFACCFVAGWPRSGLKHVLDACAGLASAVPCDVLRFTPDSGALRACGLT